MAFICSAGSCSQLYSSMQGILTASAPHARRDDFQTAQPEGRKIVAQCASTGRTSVRSQPRDGAEEPTSWSFFRPVPGLANAFRLLPTAVRRGLLSVALRALRAVPF